MTGQLRHGGEQPADLGQQDAACQIVLRHHIALFRQRHEVQLLPFRAQLRLVLGVDILIGDDGGGRVALRVKDGRKGDPVPEHILRRLTHMTGDHRVAGLLARDNALVEVAIVLHALGLDQPLGDEVIRHVAHLEGQPKGLRQLLGQAHGARGHVKEEEHLAALVQRQLVALLADPQLILRLFSVGNVKQRGVEQSFLRRIHAAAVEPYPLPVHVDHGVFRFKDAPDFPLGVVAVGGAHHISAKGRRGKQHAGKARGDRLRLRGVSVHLVKDVVGEHDGEIVVRAVFAYAVHHRGRELGIGFLIIPGPLDLRLPLQLLDLFRLDVLDQALRPHLAGFKVGGDIDRCAQPAGVFARLISPILMDGLRHAVLVQLD